MSPEKPHDVVLRLMGLLEKGLRALIPDESTPFHKQVEAHRDKFSDNSGIAEARRVRNAIAHGEDVSDSRSREAEAVLSKALKEISRHCPERLQTAIREATRPAPGAVTSDARPSDKNASVSTLSQVDWPLRTNVLEPSEERNATSLICDWVYFATPSQEDWATTRTVVSDLGMIIRTVYDSRERPNAIANAKHIRQGQTILLAHGGKGKPYVPMLTCTVVAAPLPVPHFEAFSFAEKFQEDRLERSGFARDPHLKKFTGISVEISAERPTGLILKPAGNNTIRSWNEVEICNARQKGRP